MEKTQKKDSSSSSTSRPKIQRQVVTIHGISSEGKWQEEIHPVFDPHFLHIPIKYKHYKRLGALKLVFEPWILLPGIGIAWTTTDITKIRFYVLIGIVLIVSHGASYYRRRCTLRYVKNQLDRVASVGKPPHLIAHSLGTFLCCRILKHYYDVNFNRIILAGCVLPSAFNWSDLASRQQEKFTSIWNEVATNDSVAWLAYQVRRLVPGLGNAGFIGFQGSDSLIHKRPSPTDPCPSCTLGENGVRIHNIHFDRYDHGDSFVGRGHAATFWLPYLWGIEPAEYTSFLKLCWLATFYETEKDCFHLAKIEAEIYERPWLWTGGLSLEQLVKRQIAAYYPIAAFQVNEIVSGVIHLVWNSVGMAVEELNQANPENKIIQLLNPWTAINKAVGGVQV